MKNNYFFYVIFYILLKIDKFGTDALWEIERELNEFGLTLRKDSEQGKINKVTPQILDTILDEEILNKLTTRIDDLVLSVRTKNVIKSLKIVFLWQLIELTEKELLKGKNLGRKTKIFGMPLIPYFCAIEESLSTFTFPTFTLPLYFSAIVSMVGDNILHGPHHSAQKSTTTGILDDSTSKAKFSSVNSIVRSFIEAFLYILYLNILITKFIILI